MRNAAANAPANAGALSATSPVTGQPEMISLSQAFAQWQELAANIPKDDGPALAESWNNYTDSIAKDGDLCALQYHYAPAYDDTMPGEGTRFDPLADDREFILDAMNITLTAVFVPFSQSRNKTEKNPSLNWRVTLRKDGRDVIETDYTQGCAHCPAYYGLREGLGSAAHAQAVALECETGKKTLKGWPLRSARIAIDPPAVCDVLHSLLLDASALDCRDFADWCADMGGNSDSISERAAYDACIATATKLRAAFGDKTINELRELFDGM
jgi:hypothetical protein